MFDSWGELLIIAVVALVVVGPKELPQLLRTLGQWVGKARRMAGDFQSQVNEAIREAELDDVKKSMDDLRSLSPKNLIASQLASVTSDLARVESETKTEFAEIGSSIAQPAVNEFGATSPLPSTAEPTMAAAEAERLIDAAATPVDMAAMPLSASEGAPLPLAPSDVVAPPMPEPQPMAHAEGEMPKKEPSA